MSKISPRKYFPVILILLVLTGLFSLAFRRPAPANFDDKKAIIDTEQNRFTKVVLAQKLEDYIDEHRILLEELFSLAKQLPTPGVWKQPELTAYERELFIRFTFSALVDSDYLDTEAHFNPENAKTRTVSFDAKSEKDGVASCNHILRRLSVGD